MPTASPVRRITIPPFSGDLIEMRPGQFLTIVDDEGGQIVDFFAESATDPEEILSSGVTIDATSRSGSTSATPCTPTATSRCSTSSTTPSGTMTGSIPAAARRCMTTSTNNGTDRPSCLQNINTALGRERSTITPVNLFMRTVIHPDRTISVEEPVSRAVDHVTLLARMHLRVALAACSVTESKCNSGRSTAITAILSTQTRTAASPTAP